MKKPYECLHLENQLCFPLYAVSKEIIRRYKPYLAKLDLTYTQYLVLLVMWESGSMNVTELGHRLYLDSGTLTPVLKKLEQKGYITRRRSREDERSLIVSMTPEGCALRDKAICIPARIADCVSLSGEEKEALSSLLHKLLQQLA